VRDIVLLAIVIPAFVLALRRPWIGVILWTWLSIMNPHRYTWGIAYSAPLAAAAAGCTILGFLLTKDRASPLKGAPVNWFLALIVWMTLSWLFGLNIEGDYEQWKKVMKVDFMLLVALALLHSKQHILALVSVCAASLALLGAKGGVFTLATGGGGRVYGPPGSFISDNNEFALALVMTIPLLRFLQLQIQKPLAKRLLLVTMVLCAVSALGSQSRGAMLAISAMAVMMWWRGKGNKFQVGVLVAIVAITLVAFMPDEWSNRMSTIKTYEEDGSAMGRINAWWAAWNMAQHYPFGVGFKPATGELFARFAPEPANVKAAHSIYFQVLGNHGFAGLALFLGIWISSWRMAGWLRSQKGVLPVNQWTVDLGAMCQVSLIGYLVGGAFLSLAYFDLPYNIMAIVVLTRAWVAKQSWQTEPMEIPRWMSMMGFAVNNKAT
jgi:putative inorganic carbon (HCO3(-)) transporter